MLSFMVYINIMLSKISECSVKRDHVVLKYTQVRLLKEAEFPLDLKRLSVIRISRKNENG